jgi:hypothetical protein
MNKLPTNADEHVEALIPWHVNGTLNAADTQQVQLHLQSCEQCRASVQLEQKIAGLVLERRETLDCAPQSGWSRLAAQLDARAPSFPKQSKFPRPKLGVIGKRLVPTLLLLQAAAIAGLGVALVQLLDQRDDYAYQTLSDVTPTPTAAGPTLRVVFHDDTSNEKLRTLLEPIGGTIRSGPTGNGVYTIEAQRSGSDAALEWLRAQPEVMFAEPVRSPRSD